MADTAPTAADAAAEADREPPGGGPGEETDPFDPALLDLPPQAAAPDLTPVATMDDQESPAGDEAPVAAADVPGGLDNLAAVLEIRDAPPVDDDPPVARPPPPPRAGVSSDGAGDARPVFTWSRGDEGTPYRPTIDTLDDIVLGVVAEESKAAILDVSGLVPASLTNASADLSNYLQVAVVGDDLEIQIDVDGAPNGFQPQLIITLTNQGRGLSPTSTGSILRRLIADGNLTVEPVR